LQGIQQTDDKNSYTHSAVQIYRAARCALLGRSVVFNTIGFIGHIQIDFVVPPMPFSFKNPL
jgi:hypothetical protein